MCKKMAKSFQIGEVVCDMHYGLPEDTGFPEQVPVVCKDHTRVRVPRDGTGSNSVLNALLTAVGVEDQFYTNKMAVVVGVVSSEEHVWYIAAYSYDGTTFGTFKFRCVEG